MLKLRRSCGKVRVRQTAAIVLWQFSRSKPLASAMRCSSRVRLLRGGDPAQKPCQRTIRRRTGGVIGNVGEDGFATAAGRRAAEFARFCTGLDASGAEFTERVFARSWQNDGILQGKIVFGCIAACRQPKPLRGKHLRLEMRITPCGKIESLHSLLACLACAASAVASDLSIF